MKWQDIMIVNNSIPIGYSWYLDKYANVTGKRVLVIGSQSPWLEAVLLAKGKHRVKYKKSKSSCKVE